MGKSESKITVQGQISIPADVRKKLGVGPGSVIEWEEKEGMMIVRKAGRHSSLDVHRALFRNETGPRPLVDVKAGVGKYIRRKHARG
jgi:AbrB family looped-hinge helix DNA binding protein